MQKVIIWFVFLSLLSEIQAQVKPEPLSISVFSVEDGLSQSSIQAIGQDVFGFLWISTGDGLNCYDGRSFQQYYYESLIYNSEQSNSIRNIVSDSIGNLWVGTDRGLLYLDRSRNTLLVPFPSLRELAGRPCLPLFSTDDSISMIADDLGIISIHKTHHTVSIKPLDRKLIGLSILGDYNDEKWLGFYDGTAICFTNDAFKGIQFQEFTFNLPANGFLESIISLGDGKYLCATTKDLYLFSKYDQVIERIDTGAWSFFPENKLFKSLTIGPDDKIWVATFNQGVVLLNKDFSLHSGHNTYKSFNGNINKFDNILRLFTDLQGTVWIGTDGSGIAHYKKENSMFGLVRQFVDKNGKEIIPFVRSFYEDSDRNIWFGTDQNGLIKWNRTDNTFERLLLDPQSGYPSANSIYCFIPLDETNLLIGTTLGLFQFNLQKKQHQQIEMMQPHFTINKVSEIVSNDDGTFTLLVNDFIHKLSFQNKSWYFVPSELPDSIIFKTLLHDKRIGILAFTRDGLYRLSHQPVSFFPFGYDDQVVHLDVNAACVDSELNIWLATENGLVRIDSTAAIKAYYNEREGLPSHYLYGLLNDDSGNIWISSNGGISRFETDKQKFFNYSIKDGLQSLEFNSGAYYKTAQGELFFGGISGFNYFFPDSIKQKINPANVVIRSIRVNDMPFIPDSCTMAKKTYEFSYDQNTLSFEYASVDFINDETARYTYMLDGHDPDWIEAGTDNRVRYSKLRPGKYTFRVKVEDNPDGLKNSMAGIRIVIRKPFWMTIPFITVMLIVTLMMIVAVVRYYATVRIKKRIAQLEHEQEISAIRGRISADLHDDVGSGLSKLAMMSDKAKLIAGNKTEMVEYISKISAEARQMIDQLRVIVWTLNPQEDKLDGLIAYVHHNISDYLENFPVNYKILIPDSVPARNVTPEFKRNVYYALREAVHNVIKHSEALELKVIIEMIGNRMNIKVKDNGKGMDLNSSRKFGNGIQFMEKRIKDLGGSVKFSGEPGSGTIVEFDIPV